MYFLESLKSALQNVMANKMRSFLTMLGIIIGISSVITIVSIGQGGKQYLTGQFENIGTNFINMNVRARNNDIRQEDYFTLEDVKIIENRVPKVEMVIPFLQSFGNMKSDTKTKMAAIVGTTEGYRKLQNLDIVDGRFLNKSDVESQKYVAVIDDTAAAEIFRTSKAAGKKMTVSVGSNNITVTVVGVVENPAGKLASSFGENMPGYVFIPITISDRIMADTNITQMSALLSDMEDSADTTSKIVRILELTHHNEDKYVVEEGFKQLDMIDNVLNMFTMVIGAIAGISLVVGGIGVMNIMLVSVTERTREIGIRKAMGATMTDIRLQFLTESLILCLVGGTIGMLLGMGMGYLAGRLINLAPVVSLSVVIISFLFSSAIGIFFGLYPANKAAKLDPIEALRYE